MAAFEFINPGILHDEDLSLVLDDTNPSDADKDFAPVYSFDMRHSKTNDYMGGITFRAANTDYICRYFGHFGFFC